MSNQEYFSIYDEFHSEHCACYLRVKWDVQMISGEDTANGYIVQKFSRDSSPPNFQIANTTYYEAWRVVNGWCTDTAEQPYDDEFAIGNPLLPLDLFQESLYTTGKYMFGGELFWVPHNSHLFKVIDSWPTHEVLQAGGLRSTFFFPKSEKLRAVCKRPPFVHTWDLTTESKIFNAAKQLLFRMYPDNKAPNAHRRFTIELDNMLSDEHAKLKAALQSDWLADKA